MSVALLLLAVLSAPAPDPWAPGATLEPWPLIARLQAWEKGRGAEPGWRAAGAHGDPLVRAAAAAAIGRAAEPRLRAALDPLLRDPVLLVRRTAQWALLRFGEPVPVALVEDAVFDHGPHDRYPSAFDPGLRWLLDRWLPESFPGLREDEKRSLLRTRESLRPEPPRTLAPAATLERASAAIARSEWDADEIAEMVLEVVTGAGPSALTLSFDRYLDPADPYRPRPPVPRPAMPHDGVFTRVRVVGGDGSGRLELPPRDARRVAVSFDLGGLPPDVYTIRFGNPLFLRVRRGRTDEERALAAARDLAAPGAMDTVALLRPRAAAPALRARFEENLRQFGFGFNAYRDALVLARLADPESAAIVVPALLANRAFRDPWTGSVGFAEILDRGFGGAARDAHLRIATEWRGEMAAGRVAAVTSILGDAQRREPAVVRARLDALSELAGQVAASKEYSMETVAMRDLLGAVLPAAAAHHPAEVVAALAAVAPNAYVFGTVLHRTVEPLTGRDAERVLRPLWLELARRGHETSSAAYAVAREARAKGAMLPEPLP